MSYKNILSQVLTIRLMELYENNTQEKALETISKEICEILNCEPITFVKNKNDILDQLQKIITILNNMDSNKKSNEISVIFKSLKDIDKTIRKIITEDISND